MKNPFFDFWKILHFAVVLLFLNKERPARVYCSQLVSNSSKFLLRAVFENNGSIKKQAIRYDDDEWLELWFCCCCCLEVLLLFVLLLAVVATTLFRFCWFCSCCHCLGAFGWCPFVRLLFVFELGTVFVVAALDVDFDFASHSPLSLILLLLLLVLLLLVSSPPILNVNLPFLFATWTVFCPGVLAFICFWGSFCGFSFDCLSLSFSFCLFFSLASSETSSSLMVGPQETCRATLTLCGVLLCTCVVYLSSGIG